MSDELRAARERLRLAQIKWVGAYESGHTPTQIKDELWMQDMMLIVDAYLAEHPADDDEPVDLGTCYCDDNIRIELQQSSNRQEALAFQSRDSDWEWHRVRSWTYPASATRGDVRRLLAALGIEVPK